MSSWRSGPDTEPTAHGSRTALLPAIGAGAAIALQLVFPHQAPSGSGVAPLITGRDVSSAVTLAAAGLMFRRPGSEEPAYAASATAGVLDSLAILLFLPAARSGDLAVVAVITALYPAGTVLLRGSLRAHPSRPARRPGHRRRRRQPPGPHLRVAARPPAATHPHRPPPR